MNPPTLFGMPSGLNGRVRVMGLPFDHGSEAPGGCGRAPQVLRHLSSALELASHPIRKLETNAVQLESADVSDLGDLEFKVQLGSANYLEMIAEVSAELVAQAQPFLFIGGDHLATLGTVKGLARKVAKFQIVHLDAHTDYHVVPRNHFSTHANFMYEISQLDQVERIYQFGVRGFTTSSQDLPAKFRKLPTTVPNDLPVFLTIDSDAFDPLTLGAVNFPVHGGLNWTEFLDVLSSLKDCQVLGADWMEYNPAVDTSNRISAHFILRALIELLSHLRRQAL